MTPKDRDSLIGTLFFVFVAVLILVLILGGWVQAR